MVPLWLYAAILNRLFVGLHGSSRKPRMLVIPQLSNRGSLLCSFAHMFIFPNRIYISECFTSIRECMLCCFALYDTYWRSDHGLHDTLATPRFFFVVLNNVYVTLLTQQRIWHDHHKYIILRPGQQTTSVEACDTTPVIRQTHTDRHRALISCEAWRTLC